jgi:hypothetical protein
MSETVAHTQTASQNIVNLIAMSLSSSPSLTEAERAIRFQTVVSGTAELRPADTEQTIFAGLVLGHLLTITDGLRDLASRTLNQAEAARARSGIVAQTKIVLQLLRELRVEREEALARAAAEGGELILGPAQGPAGDAAFAAPLAKPLAAYTDTISALDNADPLTPAAVAKAREALSQAISPALLAPPREERPVPAPVTGSRAQRRAMMKRSGAFKRNG